MKNTIDVLRTQDVNPFMRRTLQDFNLGSRKQIGEYLQSLVGNLKDLHQLVSRL